MTVNANNVDEARGRLDEINEEIYELQIHIKQLEYEKYALEATFRYMITPGEQ